MRRVAGRDPDRAARVVADLELVYICPKMMNSSRVDLEDAMLFSHKRRCYTAQADVHMLATGDENELHGEILTERLG